MCVAITGCRINCMTLLMSSRTAGECGGRADVRWLTLTDAQGAGIAAVTLDDPLQANVTQSVSHATLLPWPYLPALLLSPC